MHQDIEKLLNVAKEKGSISEKQREIILNKAQQLGEDMAEVEFFLEDIRIINKQEHVSETPDAQIIPTECEKAQEPQKQPTSNPLKTAGTGNSFVSVEHDSFDDKTVTRSTTLDYNLSARKLTLTETAIFKFRHVKSLKYEFLLIDVHFTSCEADIRAKNFKEAIATSPGDWAFLREGELAIRINEEETIHLPAHESDSDVTRGSFTNAGAVEEICYYEINEEILKKICDATKIRIRLTGGRAQWELDGTDLRTLAQAFYNGCFDNTKYTDQVQHATDINAKKNEIKKTGCFFEIVSVVLSVIIYSSIKENKKMDVDDYMGWVVLLAVIIPGIIALISHYKRKNLK